MHSNSNVLATLQTGSTTEHWLLCLTFKQSPLTMKQLLEAITESIFRWSSGRVFRNGAYSKVFKCCLHVLQYPGSHKPAQAHCSWVDLPLHQERAPWVARERLLSTPSSHQSSVYCPAWWVCWHHRIEKEAARQNRGEPKSSPEIRTRHHFFKMNHLSLFHILDG